MITISKECKNIGEAIKFIEKIEKKKNAKDFRIYMKRTKKKQGYIFNIKVIGNIDI